jgi:hypothetical protein
MLLDNNNIHLEIDQLRVHSISTSNVNTSCALLNLIPTGAYLTLYSGEHRPVYALRAPTSRVILLRGDIILPWFNDPQLCPQFVTLVAVAGVNKYNVLDVK